MRQRTIWSTVAAVALALVLAGCSAAEPTTEPEAARPTEPAATQPAETGSEPAAVTSVPMGTAATSGDWTLSVKETEREASTAGVDAASGNELFVVKLELTNTASTNRGTGPAFFILTDSSGAKYDPALTRGREFIYDTPQPIKAGETREIRIAYEVPVGSGPFTLAFTRLADGVEQAPAVLEAK